MRVLVACEFSGRVRDAFSARGHYAVSCDIIPSEREGLHIMCDVRQILNDGWDLMIAFPPCTHLSSSGAVYWPEKKKDGRQKDAIDLFLQLYDAPIPKIAIENPVGIISSVFRKPDQIIDPYQFGDPYRKRTCLWLRGISKLIPTNIVVPIANWHSGSTRSGKNKNGQRTKSSLPSLKRSAKDRSLTFPSIADSMAEQWGAL